MVKDIEILSDYRALKKSQYERANSFPCGFAFSDKQFEEELERLGTTKDDVISIGSGGFIRKEDKDAFIQMLNDFDAEMTAAIELDREQGTDFCYGMFKYELADHEFNYTQDVEETLDFLGLDYDEVVQDDMLHEALLGAIDYLNRQEDW